MARSEKLKGGRAIEAERGDFDEDRAGEPRERRVEKSVEFEARRGRVWRRDRERAYAVKPRTGLIPRCSRFVRNLRLKKEKGTRRSGSNERKEKRVSWKRNEAHQ